MHRFFAAPGQAGCDTVRLTEEDSRHAATVLRLKPEDNVELFLEGERWLAKLVSADPGAVTVRPVTRLPSSESSVTVTLYQGLPKSDKMDLIVQKATELGASRIVPVLMERCVVRPDPKDVSRRLERWRRIAREAAKQSGRTRIPEITEPCPLNRLPSLPAFPEKNIVPWEEAAEYGPLAFHAAHPVLSSLGILIGPEGGITGEEISLLKSSGFIPVTLGKRILRTETAGLAALSALLCLYGEMD